MVTKILFCRIADAKPLIASDAAESSRHRHHARAAQRRRFPSAVSWASACASYSPASLTRRSWVTESLVARARRRHRSACSRRKRTAPSDTHATRRESSLGSQPPAPEDVCRRWLDASPFMSGRRLYYARSRMTWRWFHARNPRGSCSALRLLRRPQLFRLQIAHDVGRILQLAGVFQGLVALRRRASSIVLFPTPRRPARTSRAYPMIVLYCRYASYSPMPQSKFSGPNFRQRLSGRRHSDRKMQDP